MNRINLTLQQQPSVRQYIDLTGQQSEPNTRLQNKRIRQRVVKQPLNFEYINRTNRPLSTGFSRLNQQIMVNPNETVADALYNIALLGLDIYKTNEQSVNLDNPLTYATNTPLTIIVRNKYSTPIQILSESMESSILYPNQTGGIIINPFIGTPIRVIVINKLNDNIFEYELLITKTQHHYSIIKRGYDDKKQNRIGSKNIPFGLPYIWIL